MVQRACGSWYAARSGGPLGSPEFGMSIGNHTLDLSCIPSPGTTLARRGRRGADRFWDGRPLFGMAPKPGRATWPPNYRNASLVRRPSAASRSWRLLAARYEGHSAQAPEPTGKRDVARFRAGDGTGYDTNNGWLAGWLASQPAIIASQSTNSHRFGPISTTKLAQTHSRTHHATIRWVSGSSLPPFGACANDARHGILAF